MTAKTTVPSAARPVGRRGAPTRPWLALCVLCVSLLIVTLDNTVLNVVLPTLARDLHATTSQLQWIVDAYVVVFAGLLLVAGSVADRVGRKRAFLADLAAFAAGSAWAAFSGVGRGTDRSEGEHGYRRRADHAVDVVDHHGHVPRRRGAAR